MRAAANRWFMWREFNAISIFLKQNFLSKSVLIPFLKLVDSVCFEGRKNAIEVFFCFSCWLSVSLQPRLKKRRKRPKNSPWNSRQRKAFSKRSSFVVGLRKEWIVSTRCNSKAFLKTLPSSGFFLGLSPSLGFMEIPKSLALGARKPSTLIR